jgi:hypothetical protein
MLVGTLLGGNILLATSQYRYKQHILSPAEVRKVCYSMAEVQVKSVYLKFMKPFKGGQGIKVWEPLIYTNPNCINTSTFSIYSKYLNVIKTREVFSEINNLNVCNDYLSIII